MTYFINSKAAADSHAIIKAADGACNITFDYPAKKILIFKEKRDFEAYKNSDPKIKKRYDNTSEERAVASNATTYASNYLANWNAKAVLNYISKDNTLAMYGPFGDYPGTHSMFCALVTSRNNSIATGSSVPYTPMWASWFQQSSGSFKFEKFTPEYNNIGNYLQYVPVENNFKVFITNYNRTKKCTVTLYALADHQGDSRTIIIGSNAKQRIYWFNIPYIKLDLVFSTIDLYRFSSQKIIFDY